MLPAVHLFKIRNKMETQDQNRENPLDWEKRWEEHRVRARKGKVLGGIFIVLIGATMLAREMGMVLPEWLFSWPMLLIVIGLYVGVKSSFRNFAWIVLMVIGGAFLMEDLMPAMNIKIYFWPVIIIALGLMMIFKPHHHHHHHNHMDRHRRRWERRHMGRGWRGDSNFTACGNQTSSSSEDRIDMDVVFSGFKKNIISKDFKGGQFSCVFGGGEINLSQADINGTAVIEFKQVFGGLKLIIPPNWEVQTGDIDTVFGGVDDKRPQQAVSGNSDKVLILKGSVVFGGIDIRSY
jgi:predicted membrane protein